MRAVFRNASSSPFHGWKRINLETGPKLASSLRPGLKLLDGSIVAHQSGYDTTAVDVRVALDPGQLIKIDLRPDPELVPMPDGSRMPSSAGAMLPGDPLAFFGIPALSSLPFSLVSAKPDGAAVAVHLRLRLAPWCYDVHLRWYPDQPGCSQGELLVTLSDVTLDVVSATLPFDALLQFGEPGKAFVQFLGLPVGAPALHAGEQFGDGQCRAFPFVVIWPEHLHTVEDYNSAAALAQWGIGGNGIANLYPTGSPAPIDAVAFFRAHWGDCVQALHRWAPPSIGVAANSAQAGAQEDQVFVGGETHEPEAELPRYLAALAQLRRPCHHLEHDGELLRLAEHPQLMLWDSRALWISQDQLGKSRALSTLESHGWWGGDVEHWLMSTLNVAARITDSEALQFALGAQARVYLKQWTVDPQLSTSQPYASRAVGWECLGAVQLFRQLRDRDLASLVLDRLKDRLDNIILPQHGSKPADVWDVRTDDLRLGTGPRFIAWQQAVEAGLMDIAGEFLANMSLPDTPALTRALAVRALALRGALRILDWSWREQPGATGPMVNWQSNPSGQSAIDGTGGDWGDSFDFFGMSFAPAVVLRQRFLVDEARVAKASSIWAELLRHDAASPWLVPGVVR